MYLKEYPVPIPFESAKIVIRNEKAVQMELSRTYSSRTQDSRVTRKTIGQAVPLDPGKMYPNENYFALVPNTVPEDIRDAFLMKCAKKRERAKLMKNPEEMERRVNEGIRFLKRAAGPPDETEEGGSSSGGSGDPPPVSVWFIRDAHDLEYARGVFSDLYALMESYAAKRPDEVVEPYKVRMINRLMEELKLTLVRSGPLQRLELIPEPEEETGADGNRRWKGLSYSDVMMLMSWYKNGLKE